MTTNKWLGLGMVLFCLFAFKQCDKAKQKSITDTNLTDNEQVAIVVNPHTGSVTTIRRNRKDKQSTTKVEKTLDGAREIRIGVSPQGRVIVSARTKGFIFEPGLNIGVSDGFKLGIDAQWAFYHRWGVISGVNADTKDGRISLHTGVNYLLPFNWIDSTSIFVSVTNRKKVYAGLRLKF